jgi:hypothetical protein
MVITANQVNDQVMGAIRALEKIPAKEREVRPSHAFIANYNGLVDFGKEAMPNVDERLWPPTLDESNFTIRFTEIHSFLEQLHAILANGVIYE